MIIRVLKDFFVPEKYCNNCANYDYTEGIFGHSRCCLFKCKIHLDGLNAIKCSQCVEAGRQIVETGCEFCEGEYVAGYMRAYIGNDLKPANPPFCPECGKRRR